MTAGELNDSWKTRQTVGELIRQLENQTTGELNDSLKSSQRAGELGRLLEN